MKKYSFFLCLALAFPGFAQAEEPGTVSWYINHPLERQEKLNWCQQSADRQATVDCQNAVSAKWQRGTAQVPELTANATPKPVDYYLQNRDEMKARVTWCNDSADRAKLQDCVNAAQANHKRWGQRAGVPKF